jgi:hypothetical protein
MHTNVKRTLTTLFNGEINRNSLLMALGLVTAAFYAVILRIGLSVGDGWTPFYTFDTDPTWSLDTASAKLEALGADGRAAYRRLNAIDSLFPVFGYTPLLILATWTMFPGSSNLAMLPLLAGFFDVVENFVVLNLLDTMEPNFKTFGCEFCDRNIWGIGHIATPLKFLFLFCSLGVVCFGIVKQMTPRKRD